MSIKGDRAAILAADGTFNTIKNENYTIGQSIEYKAQLRSGAKLIDFVSARAVKFTAAAAAAVLVAGTFTANTYAYSTVTLDVNPSLRYELNVFDRVLKFDSYNEDGEEIVAMVTDQVVGQKLDTAIEATLNALDEAEYIGEETPVVMTVDSHLSKTQALEKRTKLEMDSWNEERAGRPEKKSIDGESVVVTKELKTKARDNHVSPGRMVLMERHREPSGVREPETTEETTGEEEGFTVLPTEPFSPGNQVERTEKDETNRREDRGEQGELPQDRTPVNDVRETGKAPGSEDPSAENRQSSSETRPQTPTEQTGQEQEYQQPQQQQQQPQQQQQQQKEQKNQPGQPPQNVNGNVPAGDYSNESINEGLSEQLPGQGNEPQSGTQQLNPQPQLPQNAQVFEGSSPEAPDSSQGSEEPQNAKEPPVDFENRPSEGDRPDGGNGGGGNNGGPGEGSPGPGGPLR